jgi:glycine/D-amino acid oxidase-like deaminating enzyme
VSKPTARVVIVGGGTAGWITASLIAADHGQRADGCVDVTLIESPDVPTIGVGEGTWPSMRATLQRIGIAELDLLRHCDASFKQGTHFRNWAAESTDYYHPFSLPVEWPTLPLTGYWLDSGARESFAEFVTPQAAVMEAGLGPREAGMPPYTHVVNYGYHFDAGKFARLLHEHAVERLGVEYVSANVEHIEAGQDGHITGLRLDSGAVVTGDLFVDCTGQRSLLLGRHYGVDFVPVRDVLFNDRAIAVQVAHESPKDPIASATVSTAVDAGWIWDIALRPRRGLGYVHSSAHTSEDEAIATLQRYVRQCFPATPIGDLTFRTIPFEPGYRKAFWVKNCVAIGLSGGFIEPLEASALALIEQSAMLLSRQFPRDRELMQVVSRRFNAKLHYHWQRVIEFLKLHYVLTRRQDTPYWRDNRNPAHCPPELADKLKLWEQQSPWYDDVPHVDELFPAASYQYVLYGMGFRPRHRDMTGAASEEERQRVDRALHASAEKVRQMRSRLPTNRQLLEELMALPGVA